MILCVAASPSIDKLFEVARLTHGEIHRPLAFVQTPGGKGLNVARAAASLGADVQATGILGRFTGRWIEEALATEGIPGTFAWAGADTRASLSVADRETGDLTEFYESGWEIEPEAWDELEGAVGRLAPGASSMTISGQMPIGSPTDGYARLIRSAHAFGVPVALDAAGEALGAGLREGPEIVKVNAAEASDLLARAVASMEQTLESARELRAMAGGPGHAGVVTRGADGCVVVGPGGDTLEGRLHVRGRYPVGSGDVFLAGLAVGLDRWRDWRRALRLALGAAAANAEVPGAGRLDPTRAEELAERAEVRSLGRV